MPKGLLASFVETSIIIDSQPESMSSVNRPWCRWIEWLSIMIVTQTSTDSTVQKALFRSMWYAKGGGFGFGVTFGFMGSGRRWTTQHGLSLGFWSQTWFVSVRLKQDSPGCKSCQLRMLFETRMCSVTLLVGDVIGGGCFSVCTTICIPVFSI